MDGLDELTVGITIADVMADLETGRSVPPRRADRLRRLEALSRPTIGGRRFRATLLAARSLGRVHPALARPWLLRLWSTPWVHPAALRPVTDLATDLLAWSLPADGQHLHGYTAGSGRTVVMVHGWAGRAADWRHLAGDLVADGWRVVVPDLPAHGATAGRATDLFAMARALGVVLDREGPDVVMVHSLGFPTLLRALDGRPGRTPGTVVALAPGRRLADAVEVFATRLSLRRALVDELRRAVEDAFGPPVWDVLDVDHSLGLLPGAGLVVHDRDDREVPWSDAQQIVARWPGARPVTTAGLGHRRILRDRDVRRRVVDELAAWRSADAAGHDASPGRPSPHEEVAA